jgi:FPC/CPF motif-containing protein YcgG
MKKLKVDIDGIAFIMETSDEFNSATLFDTETGEIISIPNELMSAVESNDEEALQDLPDWERDLIGTAESIVNDESGRFVDIPRKPSYEAYNLMVEFTGSVKNKRLKEKLEIALDGKGAFRRFKNVIIDYPEEEKRWFAFKDKRMRDEVIEWLNDLGIEPEQD